MDAQRAFNRKVLTFVAVGLGAVALSAGATLWAVRQNQAFSAQVSRTYEVEKAIAEIRVPVERMEAARRGRMLQPDEERFPRIYADSAAAIQAGMPELRALIADYPEQERRLNELGTRLGLYMVIADETMRKVEAGGQTAAIRDFRADESVGLLADIRILLAEMGQAEAAKMRERASAQQRSITTLYGILAISLILLAFVAVGSIWIILGYTKQLSRSSNALRQLNEGLEGAVRERTADLKRANDEIQRFAYIVSHDLRSPLVNVMGFTAELDDALKTLSGFVDKVEKKAPALADEAALNAVRSDLPEAIGFIRTSTQKMDRLINAILQLSRQGRRVLTPEPLAMDSILGAVADTLRQRADQSGAEIVIEEPLPEIVSDRVAIEQVFSNLLENAVKYTKPGKPNRVTVRGEAHPGRVVYEVADTGRGIDPKDHERIFELFRRSGAQDQAGEGIGLAHVRALVYRLGGVISCESALDQGAVFRVSLPARLMIDPGDFR